LDKRACFSKRKFAAARSIIIIIKIGNIIRRGENRHILRKAAALRKDKTAGGSMTIVEMLGQSSVLTLLGMGVVFSFLVILIVCVSLTGKIIHALGGQKNALPPPGVPSGKNPSGENGALTAAISAAVNEYQNTH
jgi:oxaloacetate decarboxylase gamma subunit